MCCSIRITVRVSSSADTGLRRIVVPGLNLDSGVDAIISFRAMLLDLIDKIEPNQNYSKSDTLQVMRLLKNYDLIQDAQLDLPTTRDSAAPRRPRA